MARTGFLLEKPAQGGKWALIKADENIQQLKKEMLDRYEKARGKGGEKPEGILLLLGSDGKLIKRRGRKAPLDFKTASAAEQAASAKRAEKIAADQEAAIKKARAISMGEKSIADGKMSKPEKKVEAEAPAKGKGKKK